MPDFTYVALSAAGARTTGTVTANSEREAAAQLDARGLFPIEVKPTRAASAPGRFGGGVSGKHLATFYGQLADLLHSGVPLLRGLELLERQTPNARLAATLKEVRLKVADGTGLAQAMALHPKVFDELAVSMVRAGQEGGFLEDVLKRTATFVEHQNDLRNKVIGALAYPVFLGVAGFLIVNGLVIFVVPQFEDIFAKMKANGTLPLLTIGLLGLSHFLQSWTGILGAVGIVAAVVGVSKWLHGPGRMWFDGIKLRLPLFGNVALALALSRFTRIFGTMLQNGIPILKALQIAKDSTGNRVLAAAIEQSAENITGGAKLAEPFRKCKYFPTDVVEMIAIAEESNNLEKVLIDIAENLEKRTARNLDLMVKLLEPLMLLVMAVMVLLVVAGLLMPVFKLGQAIGDPSST
jgi:general secretion pathway protein F/type IV pilus assembly protein PilC